MGACPQRRLGAGGHHGVGGLRQHTGGAGATPSTAPTVPDPSQAPASSTDTELPDGTYTVGQTVAAGTYVAEPSGSCYWARFDSAGATIANDFTQGTRVQVTIKGSDFSFHSEGCGGWVLDTSAEDGASRYPDSPEADNTSCETYASVFSKAQRSDMAGRFLTTLRERNAVKPPSSALVKTFADQIKEFCALSAEGRGDSNASEGWYDRWLPLPGRSGDHDK